MVGNGCEPAGAARVNVETCKRDKNQPNDFLPGYVRGPKQDVKLQASEHQSAHNPIRLDPGVVLLITSTNAALSVKKMIR